MTASVACSRGVKEEQPRPRNAPSQALPAQGRTSVARGEALPVPSQFSLASSAPTPSAFASLASPQTGSTPLVVTSAELLKRIRKSGKSAVLVNVWASWCEPCRHELPMLERVSAELAPLGVPIWLVSIDEPYAIPVDRALLASLRIDLPSLNAAPPLERFQSALNPKWSGALPASFLFDAKGKLGPFWTGEVPETELVSLVQAFLAHRHE